MAVTPISGTTGAKVDRKLLMHFVNVGSGSTPTWEILGRGIEDASVEYNHDVNQTTDVLGLTDVDVSPAKPSIELSPNNLRVGNALDAMLLDIERRNALSELGSFEILEVHAFQGESTFQAELHKNCTIVPTSLGGSSYVGMPVTVYLSNDKELGTASITAGVPTFTKG